MPATDESSLQHTACSNTKSSRRRLSVFLFLTIIIPFTSAEDIPRHAQLFPSNDEYDATILDPRTMYGSPYGGFSRATASRLASLPWKLPDQVQLADDEDDSSTTEYYEISDHLGRRYACRIFDESQLEYGSWKDSFLDPPVFRFSVEIQQKNKKKKPKQPPQVDDSSAKPVGERVARVLGHHPSVLDEFVGETPVSQTEPPTATSELKPRSIGDRIQDEFAQMEVDRRIDVLEGLCVLRRFRYWTYAWCYDGEITRFHLTRDSEDANSPKIRLQDVAVLGYSASKKILIPHSDHSDEEAPGDYSPLGMVKEKFTHGDQCGGDGPTAKTTVHMYCCSPEETLQHTSASLLHGVPHDITMASIVRVWEDPNKDCKFHMEVCTPVLCDEFEVEELYERIELLGIPDEIRWPESKTQQQQQLAFTVHQPAKLQFLSIAEILDATFGENCLYSEKDGWWTYEYCHKRHIRQFNGAVGKKLKKDPSDDTQYVLGMYNPPVEESTLHEWEKVVNGTDVLGYQDGGLSRKRGGNGAYYELEYNNGEMCVLETENADAEVFAAIERSCSVRLSCDTAFSVTVREDSTCHYAVEVTVPTLCEHVLFKPALTKKRVVKCLPVEEQPDEQ